MPNIYNTTIYRPATFNGKFPAPFSGWDTKKIEAYSKYNTRRVPTNLHAPTIKALLKYCGLMQGSLTGALGESDGVLFAEYMRSTDNDEITDILCWDPSTSELSATRYDHDTEKYESYSVSVTFGTPIFLLLIHYSMDNSSEFKDYFDAFYGHFLNGLTNESSVLEAAAVLSDNIYRRMLSQDIPIDIPTDGEIDELNPDEHKVNNVIWGEFVHLPCLRVVKPSWTPPDFQKEFAGVYKYADRRLKKSEVNMIPTGMERYYVVSEPVVQVCRHIKETTNGQNPVRNILLRGPSGTGKTDAARAIAVGVRLPYLFYTCNTHTETMDLTGSIIPKTGDQNPVKAAELEQELHLPSDEELKIAPVYYYQSMTGFEKMDATVEDCLAVKQSKIQEYQRTLLNQSSGYDFVYGPLVQAMKCGYVFELQEPTVIVQEGVLTGLNGLLDQSGSIELPTGEVVRRHKDTVIIFTTNTHYHGCRPLNQSVLSRMHLILDVELPDNGELAERIMNRTGFTDKPQLMKMIATTHQIAEYCEENSITDGVTGMRELEQWVMSYQITRDLMRSAQMTILSSSTANTEDQQSIKETFLDPQYAEGRLAA